MGSQAYQVVETKDSRHNNAAQWLADGPASA